MDAAVKSIILLHGVNIVYRKVQNKAGCMDQGDHMRQDEQESLGPVGRQLLAKLEEAFNPDFIHLKDESHKHIGHAGARPEGETHFRLEMRSGKFAGKSRLEQQRLVHKALDEDLNDRVHALTLYLSAPND